MIPSWIYLAVSVLALAAAGVWVRAARYHQRFIEKVSSETLNEPMGVLARTGLFRDVHDLILYLVVAITAAATSFRPETPGAWLVLLTAGPMAMSFLASRNMRRNAALADERFALERRARELLQQAENAPNRWAERLTPVQLPDTPGYEVGKVHQAGTGVMSGDLMDVFSLPRGCVCCVVGDAAGHGVEASMSALQTKFLLRTYLRRFRDPAQALDELNQQLMDYERPEDFVSIFVAVFDPEAGVVRYASAGHPAAWHYRDREIRPLRSTGPVLMMDRDAGYFSREVEIAEDDWLVLLTDGLLEARDGNEFFGEERVASLIRKSPHVGADVLCKSLLDSATHFSAGPISDDVTAMAIKRIGS